MQLLSTSFRSPAVPDIPTMPSKSVSENISYTIDYYDRIGTNETISSSVWSAVGLTFSDPVIDSSSVSVEISGGTENGQYLVTNVIITTSGITLQQSFNLKITGVR